MKIRLAILLLGVLGGAASAQVTAGSVHCGRLLDVRTGHMLANQLVAYDSSGMITSVGPAGAAVPTVDLPNATCLPGLIDVHTHLTGDATMHGYRALAVSIPRETTIGAKNARITLRVGFTTVRNVGARGFTDVAVRDAINAAILKVRA
jgi:imidazolonepropionase-like amidohydrolase